MQKVFVDNTNSISSQNNTILHTRLNEFQEKCGINNNIQIEECACGNSIPHWFKVLLIVVPVIWQVIFSLTTASVVWTFVGEMFPNKLRSKMIGFTLMANFFGAAISIPLIILF